MLEWTLTCAGKIRLNRVLHFISYWIFQAVLKLCWGGIRLLFLIGIVIIVPYCSSTVLGTLVEIPPLQQLLLACACVCLWVNTHPICVKCEAEQASRHTAWNVLSPELKGDSPVFWLRYLGWAENPSSGGIGWKSNKGTIKASVGELGNLHQHA